MPSTPEYHVQFHPEFGFGQLKPTPTPKTLAAYFEEQFYTPRHGRFNSNGPDKQREDEAFNDAQRERVIQRVEALTGRPFAGMSVLDVGCGYGQALTHFRRRGAVVHGFDLASDAVAHARAQGLNVVQAGTETMAVFGAQRFDVVTLFNLLQHVVDPVAAIAELRRDVLKPGGVLVIEVPNDFNALQLAAQKALGLGPWWVAPPMQLNYFSHDSLSRLLVAQGFSVGALSATFPMEMFLLFGDNYVSDPAVGAECHRRRVAFETHLREAGGDTLERFYGALAQAGLGRHVLALAVAGA